MDNLGDNKRVDSGGSILRKLICRQVSGDAHADACKAPCNTPTRDLALRLDAPPKSMASSSTVNESKLMSSEEYVSDHSSLLSLQPWIFKKEKFQIDEERSNRSCDFSDRCSQGMHALMDNSLTEVSPQCVHVGFVHGRAQRSFKDRRNRKYSIKPISSVENCLIPQLYKDDFEFEEYVFDPVPTPTSSSARPFFITDGHRVISKSSYKAMPVSFEKGMSEEGNVIASDIMDSVAGVSSLRNLRTPKRKSRETSHEMLDISSSQRSQKLPHSKVLSDGVRLLSIGVSIGVISTIISNRREVEKLNNVLKSTENLVQDLQEELELKESLTVKELANEAFGNYEKKDSIAKGEEPFESNGTPVPKSHFSTDKEDEYSPRHLPKAELMSQIEAELEAELERLELNINESTLDGRMSALGELDPDFVADVVHGELRADMFANGDCKDQADHDKESNSSSTAHMPNANGAVSPRELSIRLHEVIQFRLEERIKELENELQHSHKQLQLAEVELLHADRPFSSSDMGSSSNQESPNDLGKPLCLNLSGDALNAYDEAYEEFMRMTDTEENMPSTTNFSNDLSNCLYSSDRNLIWGMEARKYFEGEAPWEQNLMSKGFEDTELSHTVNGDEYDDEDVEGEMLIQKIVERTRKGSPVVLHAQRLLLSMDE